jgi:hypothetical protein
MLLASRFALLALGTCACVEAGKTALVEDQNERENAFSGSSCGRFCGVHDESGCSVPTNCEVSCEDYSALIPARCEDLNTTYLECVATLDELECDAEGWLVTGDCIEQLVELEECLPVDLNQCSFDTSDRCGVCLAEECCVPQLRCFHDDECYEADGEWLECYEESGFSEALALACDEEFAATSDLAFEYSECYTRCEDVCY